MSSAVAASLWHARMNPSGAGSNAQHSLLAAPLLSDAVQVNNLAHHASQREPMPRLKEHYSWWSLAAQPLFPRSYAGHSIGSTVSSGDRGRRQDV